jgi:hypothetical protein
MNGLDRPCAPTQNCRMGLDVHEVMILVNRAERLVAEERDGRAGAGILLDAALRALGQADGWILTPVVDRLLRARRPQPDPPA